MKRYFYFCLIWLFVLSAAVLSEDTRIEKIRERSLFISKSIENDEVLHHTMNLRTLVPGIGFQNTNILFYYEFIQDDETGEILEPPLVKITIDYMIAASVGIYIEYLFDEKEKVIFHYYRAEGYECGEQRYYFDIGELIKVKSNPLEEECIDSDLTIEYEDYERSSDFTSEDLKEANRLIKKSEKYKDMFEHIVMIEQLDK